MKFLSLILTVISCVGVCNDLIAADNHDREQAGRRSNRYIRLSFSVQGGEIDPESISLVDDSDSARQVPHKGEEHRHKKVDLGKARELIRLLAEHNAQGVGADSGEPSAVPAVLREPVAGRSPTPSPRTLQLLESFREPGASSV